jgi:Tol biopolymer transport system component
LIAFQTNRDGNWEIYTMHADGSGLLNLTNTPADDELPYWRP